MVRMSDLPENVQTALSNVECPDFDSNPWVSGPPLKERRVVVPRRPAVSFRRKGIQSNSWRHGRVRFAHEPRFQQF